MFSMSMAAIPDKKSSWRKICYARAHGESEGDNLFVLPFLFLFEGRGRGRGSAALAR